MWNQAWHAGRHRNIRSRLLLHGEKPVIYSNADYTGVEKRAEYDDRQLIWQIEARAAPVRSMAIAASCIE